MIELQKIKKCSILANNLGLEVHAGHGLDYKTTKFLNKIKQIKEFNIEDYLPKQINIPYLLIENALDKITFGLRISKISSLNMNKIILQFSGSIPEHS